MTVFLVDVFLLQKLGCYIQHVQDKYHKSPIISDAPVQNGARLRTTTRNSLFQRKLEVVRIKSFLNTGHQAAGCGLLALYDYNLNLRCIACQSAMKQ